MGDSRPKKRSSGLNEKSKRRQAVSGDHESPWDSDDADEVLMRALRLLGEATAVLIEQRVRDDKNPPIG